MGLEAPSICIPFTPTSPLGNLKTQWDTSGKQANWVVSRMPLPEALSCCSRSISVAVEKKQTGSGLSGFSWWMLLSVPAQSQPMSCSTVNFWWPKGCNILSFYCIGVSCITLPKLTTSLSDQMLAFIVSIQKHLVLLPGSTPPFCEYESIIPHFTSQPPSISTLEASMKHNLTQQWILIEHIGENVNEQTPRPQEE